MPRHPTPPHPSPPHPTLAATPDVEEGGETVFMKEGRGNADVVVTDFKACKPGEGRGPMDCAIAHPRASPAASPAPSGGARAAHCRPSRRHLSTPPPGTPVPTSSEHFKYKPRRGDAVLFYSLDPDLKINPRSLHGGCPVVKGEVRGAGGAAEGLGGCLRTPFAGSALTLLQRSPALRAHGPRTVSPPPGRSFAPLTSAEMGGHQMVGPGWETWPVEAVRCCVQGLVAAAPGVQVQLPGF
jgi:hypothetical protein